jgi:hypothetical protein
MADTYQDFLASSELIEAALKVTGSYSGSEYYLLLYNPRVRKVYPLYSLKSITDYFIVKEEFSSCKPNNKNLIEAVNKTGVE